MKKKFLYLTGLGLVLMFGVGGEYRARAQRTEAPSIGGKEHEAHIYGVKIGMEVPTALEAVFINANRPPGKEKPDAKKYEGKDNKDVRVVYKNLPLGELQIVFAGGQFVREMVLIYANPLLLDDLRLPFTSSLGNSTSLITTSTQPPPPPGSDRGKLSTDTSVLDGTKEIDGFNATNTGNVDRRRGEALEGTRYDDRYTIAFTDNQKLQKIWFRDEKLTENYRARVQFVSEKTTKAGANQVVRIIQKMVFFLPSGEVNSKQ